MAALWDEQDRLFTWATMRRSISRCADSRLPAIASISSMNTMHGASSAASWNSCRTFASDSPGGAAYKHVSAADAEP